MYQLYALSGSGHDIEHYTCKEEVCSDGIEEKGCDLLKPSGEEVKVQDVTEIFRACFRETDHNEPYSRYMTSHQVYEHLCRMHKKAMVKISFEKFAKLLPTLATMKHTERGNVYRLVTIN